MIYSYQQVKNFAFCVEPGRIRYAYVQTIGVIYSLYINQNLLKTQEVTKIEAIGEGIEEKGCQIAEGRQPVRAFFFLVKSGRLNDQNQPTIYKVEMILTIILIFVVLF